VVFCTCLLTNVALGRAIPHAQLRGSHSPNRYLVQVQPGLQSCAACALCGRLLLHALSTRRALLSASFHRPLPPPASYSRHKSKLNSSWQPPVHFGLRATVTDANCRRTAVTGSIDRRKSCSFKRLRGATHGSPISPQRLSTTCIPPPKWGTAFIAEPMSPYARSPGPQVPGERKLLKFTTFSAALRQRRAARRQQS
jgi:hypothetical protein